ncbi:MAG: hypothetical protein J5746_10250 [Victivallales bacterium]|nr:hypothetical protein [Victivallales bacterium]
MKRKSIIAAAILLTSLTGMAGNNLIMNGTMQSKNGDFPPFWTYVNSSGGKYVYHRDGGPEGMPYVTLAGRGDKLSLKQVNLTLVRGEKYLLSAYFRTRGVKNKETGIIVGTGPWAKSDKKNCIYGLPENMTEWRRIEKTITLSPEPEKENYKFYTVDVTLDAGGGEMDVTDIRLEAISEKAKETSLSVMETYEPHLVPVCPLFELDQAKPSIEFSWVGKFPGNPDETIVELSFDANGKKKQVPFQFGRFTVNLQGVIPKGESRMTVKLLDKSGKVLQEESFNVRSIVIPVVKNAKRLNNLTVEICNKAMKAGETFTTANPRFGFLLFRFRPATSEKFNVTLDGEALFDQSFPRCEVIRQLEAGTYTVKADVPGTLTVRLIPDIINFGGPSHAYAPGNGYYNWSFQKKYVTGGMTTFTAGGFSDTQYAEMKKLGLMFLEDVGILNMKEGNTREATLRTLEKSKIPGKRNDGMTLDEAECFYPPLLDPLAYALKTFKNPTGKTIMTYMTGPITPATLNFLSASANASGVKGFMSVEYYIRSQRDEEGTRNTIDQLKQHQLIFKEAAPRLYSKAGVMLGNFCLYPRISLAHFPFQDYKVFLDMQMNALANDPAFDGVGKIGFWGTYACDEEMVRWSFALMRHYVFEGKKNMLSEQYGYKLMLDYLKNTDFTSGLDGWKATGDIKTDSFPGYGGNSLGLWSSNSGKVGDDFAVFTRHEGKANVLEQTAKGLVKGRKYCLFFHTGDLDDIICGRPEPKRVPITVSLSNAEILKKTHFCPPSRGKTYAASNTEKIIFTATGSEVKLTFTDTKAAPGRACVLNYVALRPYFEP